MLVVLLMFNLGRVATADAAVAGAPRPVISPGGGVFGSNILVRVTVSDPATSLRYTLDGAEPHAGSPAYTAPFVVSNTTLVRVMAFDAAGQPSAAAAAVFTVLAADLGEFTSNLPLIIVHSFGTNLQHDARIAGALQVVDGAASRTTLGGPLNFSGRALLNIRGRASLRYPKNSFTVKTIDPLGDTASVMILGMPADSDWVLYAPYPDKTLMRDVLAYELHTAMGHWAPRTRFVEVFVNRGGGRLGRRDYAGVYVFEERIKRSSDRVNVVKLKPDDVAEPEITGGYIFKKDHVDQGGGPYGGEAWGAGPQPQGTRAGYPTGPGGFPADPRGFPPAARVTRSTSGSSSSRTTRTSRVLTNHLGFAATRPQGDASGDAGLRDQIDAVKDEENFRTARTNEFYFVEPGPDEITSVQKDWLKRHLNAVESTLYSAGFREPTTGYQAFLDPDSFIDYHLITEVSKNVDGYRFSVFYHKDRGGRIKADPIWDWNLSFGNANGKQGWLPEYWLWPQLDDRECTWYRRLFEDPDFGQRYVDRWDQLRTNVLAAPRLLARIDQLAAQLHEAQQRNFGKWPILGRPINPNYFAGATYEEEIEWMKQFIRARLAWIGQQFLPVPVATRSASGTGDSVSLTTTVGEVYFTTDGTDPRAPGGEPSARAQVGRGAIPLAGAPILARTRLDRRWSGPVTVHR